MKEIKLIVEYSYQEWNGSTYDYPKRALIFSFKTLSEISQDSILKRLHLLHNKNNFDIYSIRQIIEAQD